MYSTVTAYQRRNSIYAFKEQSVRRPYFLKEKMISYYYMILMILNAQECMEFF